MKYRKKILIYFYLAGITFVECRSTKEGTINNPQTKVKQTYRFDLLPNSGSYSIVINKLSADINLIGRNSSEAKLTIIKSYLSPILAKDIKKAHSFGKIDVIHFEDEKSIYIAKNQEDTTQYNFTYLIKLDIPEYIDLNFQIEGGDIKLENINGETRLETNGGDINISDYEGRLTLKTNGGNLNISDLSGHIRSHSTGGNIELKNSEGEIYLSTYGGNINLYNLKGKVESHSIGGSIMLKNIDGEKLTCKSLGGYIRGERISCNSILDNEGAGIQLKYMEGNFKVNSSGGSVIIDDLIGEVNCRIKYGDVELKSVSGRVDIINSSGDTNIEFVYDSQLKNNSIYIENYSGNIMLDMPKNLPFILAGNIYNSTSQKDINSEIPLNIKVKDKVVISKRTVGAGTIPIKLNVYNGTITIKET